MTLRWESQKDGCWWAYSLCSEMIVGMVVPITAGNGGRLWTYSLQAVHYRWITKGCGNVKSRRQAKRSLERAWSDWLAHAGLISKDDVKVPK